MNERSDVKRKRGKVVPITNLREPEWEKQPGESPKQWAYFQLYRDLGSERSVTEVANQSDLEPGHLYDIGKRWRWKDRCDAWERHLDEIKVKEYEEAGRTMARRQATLGILLQEKAEGALKKLVYDEENQPSAKDVVVLAEAGVKIERLARGEKTDDGQTINVILPTLPDWAKGSPVVKAANPDESANEEGERDGKQDDNQISA